jgi:hypothetical protein
MKRGASVSSRLIALAATVGATSCAASGRAQTSPVARAETGSKFTNSVGMELEWNPQGTGVGFGGPMGGE